MRLNEFLQKCGAITPTEAKQLDFKAYQGRNTTWRSQSNPSVSISFSADDPERARVDFFDLHASFLGVRFKAGVAERVIVGNTGRSGFTEYKASASTLGKFASAAQTHPDPNLSGDMVHSLGRAFGFDNVNWTDSRGAEFSVKTLAGARRILARIREQLSPDFLPSPRVVSSLSLTTPNLVSSRLTVTP